MTLFSKISGFVLLLLLVVLAAFPPAAFSSEGGTDEEKADRTVTLLFTNDVESAYDPIPAHWRSDMDMIGGIAEMTTLIRGYRKTHPNVFLFDAGDIFTGSLAKETEGALAFELMTTMGYDAMGIGNHEFEYGVEIFAWAKNRAPFPVLGANMFYRGTDHPFAQAHAIIERGGIRIGVIGIMGRDAVSAIIPSNIAALDVTAAAEAVQKSVDAIRADVDLVVLLTHEGKTAPMQTDAESDPRLQRDIDADIRLAGAVRGVDILFAGHADAGTLAPVVHPKTGTLIMQTYGQATHLGYLQLVLDGTTGRIKSYDGKLVPVDASHLVPDALIAAKLAKYRGRFPDLFKDVGMSAAFMARKYIEESDVGNLFADVIRTAADTQISFIHAGSLRKDIPKGVLTKADLLDVYPFVDDVMRFSLTGAQLREILEQSLTQERGLMQISGFTLSYDYSRPIGARLVTMQYQGRDIAPTDRFTAAAPGFLAEGGDLFTTFAKTGKQTSVGTVADIIVAHFAKGTPVSPPKQGRQRDVAMAP
jgi:5'-nucleotidase / UDP-sugar diphosphatase